jgi:CheY-like chemotaxis protein/predicted kinase
MLPSSPSLVIVIGPPLAGRTELARALAARRGAALFQVHDAELPADAVQASFDAGEDVILDGEFARRAERERAIGLAPESALLVDWISPRSQAERDAFQRYAGRPRPIEEAALRAYDDDAVRREPLSGEVDEDRLVVVSSAAALTDQVLSVEEALPPRSLRASVPPSTGRSVLVVEDDDDTRAVVIGVLRELGYQAEGVADGEAALARLERGPMFQVVLVDQRLPGMSGTELIETLRHHRPAAHAILLTGWGDDPTCAAALRAHVDNVLAKPVRVMDLQRALEEVLGPSP